MSFELDEAKLVALRAALDESEASGVATPFDFEAFIVEKRLSRRKQNLADEVRRHDDC